VAYVVRVTADELMGVEVAESLGVAARKQWQQEVLVAYQRLQCNLPPLVKVLEKVACCL